MKQKLQKTNFFSPAKVNLTLHVVGQHSNGLHLLDSLITFPLIGDTLSFSNAKQLKLSIVTDKKVSLTNDRDNLILKAAKIIDKEYLRDIILTKRLPISAGIGGGSANAAAIIRDAISLGYEVSSKNIRSLGADVMACLHSQPLRMRGTGEIIKPINIWPMTGSIILVNPGIPLETKKVFNALSKKKNRPMPERLPVFSNFKTLIDFIKTQRNDLENTAIDLGPIIEKVLIEIKHCKNCLISRMSGSGATCFGLFEKTEDAVKASYRIKDTFPDWWVVSSQISICKKYLKAIKKP